MTYQSIESVSCRYGAPMGRAGNLCDPSTDARFHVRRIRLNSGGYDSGGAYWGHGAPLYHAISESGEHELFFRLESAERRAVSDKLRGRLQPGFALHDTPDIWRKLDKLAARAIVKQTFPYAKFFGRIRITGLSPFTVTGESES